MIIFVVSGISSLKAFRMRASVFVSTALVESSRIRIFGFFRSALAMQSLCFLSAGHVVSALHDHRVVAGRNSCTKPSA